MEEKYFDVEVVRKEIYRTVYRVKATSRKAARELVEEDECVKFSDTWDAVEQSIGEMHEVPIDDVVFLSDCDGVTAVFPKTEWDNNGSVMCYSHIGQHSGCSIDWAKKQREATEAEYLPLKKELEDRGYILNIVPKDSL